MGQADTKRSRAPVQSRHPDDVLRSVPEQHLKNATAKELRVTTGTCSIKCLVPSRRGDYEDSVPEIG